MNKAVSWNVNGVGFDAREAAREAARRQGKSLGEWLHDVISDHADGLGVAETEMAPPQKIDAVTSKLERLSVRSQEHDRHVDRVETSRRPGRPEETSRGDDPDRPSRHRRRDSVAIDAAEFVLEEAIEVMERRAQRAERRTDKALQSMTELLQRNETRRERERESVSALASKLADIETRLSDRLGQADDNPIKGALARLEARLDSIGRRNAAEGLARQRAAENPTRRPVDASAQGGGTPESDPLYRLEDKLNTILQAVQNQPERLPSTASPAAIAASQAANDRTRLGEAINEITRRQHSLDDSAPSPSLRDAILRRRAADKTPPREAATPLATQSEISTLASKIEDLRRDVVARNERPQRPLVDLDAMRGEIAAMSEALRDLASRRQPGGETPIPAPGLSSDALTKIETKIERLAAKIDAVVDGGAAAPRPSAQAVPDAAAIEGLVRDLGRKMEAAQAPGAGPEAFDSLQSQIAALSTRFERSDHGLDQLASLERSMRDLFTHLEDTRASVETSAQHAAREVLRIAVEEGRAQTEKGAATSLATMQALQEDADARTSETLSAVHETLEKVVERLTMMESDLAEVRRRPQVAVPTPAARSAMPLPASPAPAMPAPSRTTQADTRDAGRPREISLGAPDPLIDPVRARRAVEPAAKPAPRLPVSAETGDEERRAGFIAAARRAAKAAQSDPSLAEFKRPSARTEPETAARAGLIEQSRDYVARHKRPVLLSIAALFVIVGTLAIVQRIGLGGSDTQMADATPPSPVMRAVDPRPSQSGVLTPSALPRNAPTITKAIPGSDPIQTGSIPSLPSSNLPSFAAQSPAAQAAAPATALPEGLKTMAKAGDRAAEYALGAQYAEGRVVPRDFKAAASWYQKAADQGVVPAQYRLASLYEKGLGVVQDKGKARALYLRAAEAGNPRAMHNLAVMLADGDGHPDYEGAATWFRKAAQYGVHDSQYNLAILLARGLGTQQSFIQSYQWFTIAAAQNDVDASKKRDEVATRLNANDLAVAKALAAAFRPRVADTAAVDVQPPPGGWDGAAGPSPLNSPRSKISML